MGFRCTDVSLIPHVNEMLGLDVDTRELDVQSMNTFVHSHAPVGTSAAYPWIATTAASNVRLHPPCEYADLAGVVRSTLGEFVPGVEQRHVSIVHATADRSFFVVAWQLATAHMASLAAATETGRSQANSGSNSAVAAANSSVAARAAQALARVS